jgi:hypothetical protein
MRAISWKSQFMLVLVMAMAGVFAGGAGTAMAAGTKVMLSGTQEVPPVKTSASGNGTITVGANKSISGSVTTLDVVGMMAHIHRAAPGKNGPVLIPLKKTSDNKWSVPANAKLTDAQYKSYKAGNLYVNVHSKAHPNGEIRGQLKP